MKTNKFFGLIFVVLVLLLVAFNPVTYNRISLENAKPGDCVWVNIDQGETTLGAVFKLRSVEDDDYYGVLYLRLEANTKEYLCDNEGCWLMGKGVDNLELVDEHFALTKEGARLHLEWVSVGYCSPGMVKLK